MDCIRIWDKLKELKENPDTDPNLVSLLHLVSFNLKEMTVIMDSDIHAANILELVRGKTYERPRGQNTLRGDASNCDIKGKWPKEMGEFAFLWSITYKGNKTEEPSIKEVVIGIYHYHMDMVEENFTNLKEKGIDIGLYRNNMRKAFNHLLISLDMGDHDIDKPMNAEEHYMNPNSPHVQLILTLYSMEPPFYAELNNACRTLDKSKLKSLGPFARAIFSVLSCGVYSDRKRDDKI